MKFELSELALEDIDNIWAYTVLNWSMRLSRFLCLSTRDPSISL